MEKTFASRLKKVLILAVILNLAIIVMQGFNTNKTIHSSKDSLILIGKTALSSFEGGRRAHFLLSTDNMTRFRTFVNDIGAGTGVKSLYLFNQEGEVLFNTKNITPPHINPRQTPEGIFEAPDGLFMYHTLGKPQRMMGNMHPPQGRRQPQFSDDPILVAGVLLDTTNHRALIRSEIVFLIGMILLELLLISVYVYTARILKVNAEQSKRLEASEREAELGQMSRLMAHELKNPLSTVKGLMEFSAKKSEGELKDISESCVDELSRLDRIINDYLSYGKDMTLNLTDTNIKDLSANAAKLLNIDAQSKGINIKIDGESSPIKADCEKIRQIIFNLLLNAIQGSPDDSEINVIINQDGFTVSNEIANKDFDPDSLGKPFYTTKTIGTGLGLAIVKRIVQLHGFNIHIQTDELFSVQIKYS